MRLLQIGLLILSLALCYGCDDPGKERSEKLSRDLLHMPFSSPCFDSAIVSVDSLPAKYAVPLLLNVSQRNISDIGDIQKKEDCLLRAYDMSNGANRKKVLQRMISFYFEELYCYMPEQEDYALGEGYKRCLDLEKNYSLSDDEMTGLYDRKAEYLKRMGLFEEALKLHYNLLEYYQEKDNPDLVVSELRALTYLYSQMGDKPKSWELNRKAYRFALSKGLTNRQAAILFSLYNDSYTLGKYSECINILKKVLPVNSEPEFRVYFKFAQVYTAMGKTDSARFYLRKTLFMENPDGRAENYRRMADTFVHEGYEDSATFYFNKARIEFGLFKEKNPDNNLSGIGLPYSSFISTIHYARLLERKGKINEAVKALDVMRPIIFGERSFYNLSESIGALKIYASLYRKLGRNDLAFGALDRRDSLQNDFYKIQKDNLREITRRYKNKELISSIDLQDRQLRYSTRILVLSLFLIAVLTSVAFIFWWMYRRKNHQLSVICQKQKEIQRLKTVEKPNSKTPDEQLLDEIERILFENELFRDPDLSLDRLVETIEVNRSYISSCINTCSGKNFNQWLNGFRIAYILERLSKDSDITALYKSAGFSSSASFYRSFKQYTSMSPNQYIAHYRTT